MYVRRDYSTDNGTEGFWNIMKKQINGIYHFVSAKHLQRYFTESTFSYNHRESFQMNVLQML
jgi:hypothetical protein